MANKFHRLLTDAELHRPERVGEGDPNQQSLPDLIDGQYYQDTLTGDVWRYVLNQEDEPNSTWERLLAYDRAGGLITNAQQSIDLRTSKIGELSAAIAEGDGVSGFNAYLYSPVSAGEELTIIDSANVDNTITLTVSADVEAGERTVSTQTQTSRFSFPVGSPIELEGAQMKSYAQADPTKIIRSLSLERDARVLGRVDSSLVASGSYTNISVTRPSTAVDTVVRNNQYLRLYDVRGDGQYVRVSGDQTLSGSSVLIDVDTFTAENDYLVGESYLEEPTWQSSTQISQTANTVSILSGTVTDLGTSVSSINTRTGVLEANVTALASVDDGQNNSIATFSATANSAYAAANLSVQYNDTGAYIQLLAGTTGGEITLQANNINISGLITAINGAGGVDADATQTISADNAPTTRESGANLEVGDVWIDTDDGNKPYVWQNIAGTEQWVAAYTTINGGDITTGSINASLVTTGTLNVTQVLSANAITTRELNVANLFAQSIDVGNVIKSSNFGANNGFAIYSNGDAIFRQVEVDGKIITGTGSSIDGTYVSNINAGNITVGSIDANVITVSNLNASLITAGSIDANVIQVSNLNASLITAGSIDANVIAVNNINASQIVTGTLEANRIDVNVQLNASQIVTGTLNAAVVDVVSINASEITTGSISGWEINDGFLQSNNNTIRLDSLSPTGAKIILYDGDDYIILDESGLETYNDALASSTRREYFLISRGSIKSGNIAPGDAANSTFVETGSSGLNVYNLSATISNDLTVGGNVQASYKSDDGTAGISDTITFFDSQATLTNNVIIKNGIITSWTQS